MVTKACVWGCLGKCISKASGPFNKRDRRTGGKWVLNASRWYPANSPLGCLPAIAVVVLAFAGLPHKLTGQMRLTCFCSQEKGSLSLWKMYVCIHIKWQAHGGLPWLHNSKLKVFSCIISVSLLPSQPLQQNQVDFYSSESIIKYFLPCYRPQFMSSTR